MELIRYSSWDDIQHFLEHDTDLIDLLRNTCYHTAISVNEDDNKKEEEYQFNVPIKIIIPTKEK